MPIRHFGVISSEVGDEGAISSGLLPNQTVLPFNAVAPIAIRRIRERNSSRAMDNHLAVSSENDDGLTEREAVSNVGHYEGL